MDKTPENTNDSSKLIIPKTPKKLLRRKSYIIDIDDSNTIIRNLDKDFQDCENKIVLNNNTKK